MTTGLNAANGSDLDSLFATRTLSKASDTNFLSNGSVDIANRFQPFQGGTKATATGFRVQGGLFDLNNIFQKLGVPYIGADWPEGDTTWYSSRQNVGTASSYLYVSNDGTFFIELINGTNINGSYLSETGAGKGNGFYVKWTGTPAPITNMGGAGSWNAIGASDLYIGLANSTPDTVVSGSYTVAIAYDNAGSGAVTWSGQIRASQVA